MDDNKQEDTQPIQKTVSVKPQDQSAKPAEKEKRRWPLPWPVGYLALWLVALSSLMLNVFVIRELLLSREAVLTVIDDAITVVQELQTQSIDYTFTYSDTVIVEADIPVNETIPVDIEQVIPIDTVVNVPVTIPLLGRYTIAIPIQTDIPVHIQDEVTLEKTFYVYTAVPIELEMPVSIPITSISLFQTLEDLEARLEGYRASLTQPIGPIPIPGPE